MERNKIPGMEGGGRQFRRTEVGEILFPRISSERRIYQETRNGKEQRRVHKNRRKAGAVSRIEKRM
jgi:hypothetical protein